MNSVYFIEVIVDNNTRPPPLLRLLNNFLHIHFQFIPFFPICN